MKNIISKSVFTSLLILCLATVFTDTYGQNPMSLTVIDNTGLAVDHYIASWSVYSINPTTQWPCSYYSQNIGLPTSYPFYIYFFANVNDLSEPFYAYVRVVGYNALNNPIVGGGTIVGPMTTKEIQGSWAAGVTVVQL